MDDKKNSIKTPLAGATKSIWCCGTLDYTSVKTLATANYASVDCKPPDNVITDDVDNISDHEADSE
jgi:hypothetical protein